MEATKNNSIKTMVMERKQEEMQFLGVLGIYQEAYKIIFSSTKIFSQITLALILPLSFILLAQIEVSNVFSGEIMNNFVELLGTEAGTERYNKISDHISSEFAYFWLFKVAHLILSLVFSLLSNAAVVYTIASIYAGREVSFKKVMSAVPKRSRSNLHSRSCWWLDLRLFTYDPTIHNVVAVNRGGYSSCITPAGARVYKSGNDQIKLSKGQNFFICNVAEHCESGMKIAINAA
uniref:Phytocyanin domain-containing protein n=1 Tax=Salix viminalis TaxID=40686 RepID=A0A6N2MK95_SALVM